MRCLFATVLVLTAGVIGLVPTGARTPQTSGASDQASPAMLERKSKPPAEAPALPPLPAGADAIEPMTFEVAMTWRAAGAPARRSTQTVMRTADRVLLVLNGTDKEWLFERNPVDTRRVSAYLIDHTRKEIVTYSDTQLRNGHQLRGWADVLAMIPASDLARGVPGVDAARLADPRLRFPHYVELDAADAAERRR